MNLPLLSLFSPEALIPLFATHLFFFMLLPKFGHSDMELGLIVLPEELLALLGSCRISPPCFNLFYS